MIRSCVILQIWENHRAKGGFTPLIFRRVYMPSSRKEGGRDNGYISGFVFILYVHCCPYQSAVSDF